VFVPIGRNRTRSVEKSAHRENPPSERKLPLDLNPRRPSPRRRNKRRRMSRIARGPLSAPPAQKQALAHDSQRRRSSSSQTIRKLETGGRPVTGDWIPSVWTPITGTEGPMRNRIDIDHIHSQAISREIGERLRASLRVERELPPSIRNQIGRLRELEGESPSIVPTMEHGPGNESRTNERPVGTRPSWWRRKQ
jgi:hypothetical protein